MSVSPSTIEGLERLAALELDAGERERLRRHLQRILSFTRQLDAIDTSGIEPTSSVVPETSRMREDEVRASLPRDEVLASAPAHADGHFEVPPVLDGDEVEA